MCAFGRILLRPKRCFDFRNERVSLINVCRSVSKLCRTASGRPDLRLNYVDLRLKLCRSAFEVVGKIRPGPKAIAGTKK